MASPVTPTPPTLIACKTLMEEMDGLLPSRMDVEILASGLHVHADQLREALQAKIHEITAHARIVILGYGLCSMGVVGLKSEQSTLIIPRQDDCISTFLGSRETYKTVLQKRPGTYFLSRGWIKAGITLVDDLKRMEARYGRARAERVMDRMLAHYTHLAFIHTGTRDPAPYQRFAREAADRLRLTYEEIRGTQTVLKKMVRGPWDDDFVVLGPGQTVSLSDFAPIRPE